MNRENDGKLEEIKRQTESITRKLELKLNWVLIRSTLNAYSFKVYIQTFIDV